MVPMVAVLRKMAHLSSSRFSPYTIPFLMKVRFGYVLVARITLTGASLFLSSLVEDIQNTATRFWHLSS